MDGVESDLPKLKPMLTTVTVDMEAMGAMDMVDIVASDLPKLKPMLTMVMVDMEAMGTGDTAERDLLKLTVVDTVAVMEDVVTVDVGMADVDTADVDTESNLLTSKIISKCRVDH